MCSLIALFGLAGLVGAIGLGYYLMINKDIVGMSGSRSHERTYHK